MGLIRLMKINLFKHKLAKEDFIRLNEKVLTRHNEEIDDKVQAVITIRFLDQDGNATYDECVSPIFTNLITDDNCYHYHYFEGKTYRVKGIKYERYTAMSTARTWADMNEPDLNDNIHEEYTYSKPDGYVTIRKEDIISYSVKFLKNEECIIG